MRLLRSETKALFFKCISLNTRNRQAFSRIMPFLLPESVQQMDFWGDTAGGAPCGGPPGSQTTQRGI